MTVCLSVCLYVSRAMCDLSNILLLPFTKVLGKQIDFNIFIQKSNKTKLVSKFCNFGCPTALLPPTIVREGLSHSCSCLYLVTCDRFQVTCDTGHLTSVFLDFFPGVGGGGVMY